MRTCWGIGLLLAVGMSACVSFAADEPDWQQTKGPLNEHGDHDRVRNIYPHPTKADTAYVRTESRMYRTEDYGESWSPFGPRRGRAVSEILFHPHKPGTLLARLDDSLWISDDDGENWRRIYRRRSDPLMAVMFHETDKDTIYCLHKSALLTTNDAGKTWSEEALEVEASDVVCATRSGKPLALGVIKERLRVYVPGEKPKEITPEGKQRFQAAVMAFNDSSRMAAVSVRFEGHLYLTRDTGKNWEEAPLPAIDPVRWMVFDPHDTDRLLMATREMGMFEYDFAGERLRAIGDVVFPSAATCCAAVGDGKTLWAGTESDGVWLYRPDAPPVQRETEEQTARQVVKPKRDERWHLSSGPSAGGIDHLAIHPKNADIVLVGGPGMMRSDDGGDSWERIIPAPGSEEEGVSCIRFSPSEPDTVFAVFYLPRPYTSVESSRAKLFASPDAGKSWKRVNRMRITGARIHVDPFDAAKIYQPDGGSVFANMRKLLISNDGGRVFQAADQFPFSETQSFWCDQRRKGVLYSRGRQDNQPRLAFSSDHGQTWTVWKMPSDDAKERLSTFALDPANPKLVLARTKSGPTGGSSYWYRYTDEDTWEIYYSDDTDIEMSRETKKLLDRVFPPSASTVDVGGSYERGIHVAPSAPNTWYRLSTRVERSRDGGKTWKDVSAGIHFADVQRLFPHASKPDAAFCIVKNVGLFRTDDLGKHWEQVHPDKVRLPREVFFHPLKPDTHFIVDTKSLWRTDDDGKTLTLVLAQQRHPIFGMSFDPDDPNRIYCYRREELWSTTDGGKTWQQHKHEKPATWFFASSMKGAPRGLCRKGLSTLRLYVPGEKCRDLDLSRVAKELGFSAESESSRTEFVIKDATIHPADSSRLAFKETENIVFSTDSGETWKHRGFWRMGGFFAYTFHPLDKDVVVLLTRDGKINSCNLVTGTVSQIADATHCPQLRSVAVSFDGKTVWAWGEGAGIWAYKTQ